MAGLAERQMALPVDSLEPETNHWSCNCGYTDIDKNHADFRQCAVYANDIYHHLRVTELLRRPAQGYMEEIQYHMSPKCRGILVDWLVEKSINWSQILFIWPVHISTDSFPQMRSRGIVYNSLSKFLEQQAPQVEDLCNITDHTYDRTEPVLKNHTGLSQILSDYSPSFIAMSYGRRFIRAAQVGYMNNLQLECLAKYLGEIALLEYSVIQFVPSVIAASAVFLAEVILHPQGRSWTPTLHHYTGYKPSDLQECVLSLHALQVNTKGCTLSAVREKYRQPVLCLL
eukprot:jgi/Mesen1/8041/ME000428S07246